MDTLQLWMRLPSIFLTILILPMPILLVVLLVLRFEQLLLYVVLLFHCMHPPHNKKKFSSKFRLTLNLNWTFQNLNHKSSSRFSSFPKLDQKSGSKFRKILEEPDWTELWQPYWEYVPCNNYHSQKGTWGHISHAKVSHIEAMFFKGLLESFQLSWFCCHFLNYYWNCYLLI